MATRWAKKNLPRISQDSIDYADALVTAGELPKRRNTDSVEQTEIENIQSRRQRWTENTDIEVSQASQQRGTESTDRGIQTEHTRKILTVQAQTEPHPRHRVIVEAAPERSQSRVRVRKKGGLRKMVWVRDKIGFGARKNKKMGGKNNNGGEKNIYKKKNLRVIIISFNRF